jgi:hypothetical protein
VTSPESRDQPARLPSTPRPRFEWLYRISVFWQYPRVFAPLASACLFNLLSDDTDCGISFFVTKMRQPFFEFAFL